MGKLTHGKAEKCITSFLPVSGLRQRPLCERMLAISTSARDKKPKIGIVLYETKTKCMIISANGGRHTDLDSILTLSLLSGI